MQISWWTACSNSLLLRMALTWPSLFWAQKGVVTSTLDWQTSSLEGKFEQELCMNSPAILGSVGVIIWTPREGCLSLHHLTHRLISRIISLLKHFFKSSLQNIPPYSEHGKLESLNIWFKFNLENIAALSSVSELKIILKRKSKYKGNIYQSVLLVRTKGPYYFNRGFLHTLLPLLLNSKHPPQEWLIVIYILGDGRVRIGWTLASTLKLIILDGAG